MLFCVLKGSKLQEFACRDTRAEEWDKWKEPHNWRFESHHQRKGVEPWWASAVACGCQQQVSSFNLLLLLTSRSKLSAFACDRRRSLIGVFAVSFYYGAIFGERNTLRVLLPKTSLRIRNDYPENLFPQMLVLFAFRIVSHQYFSHLNRLINWKSCNLIHGSKLIVFRANSLEAELIDLRASSNQAELDWLRSELDEKKAKITELHRK